MLQTGLHESIPKRDLGQKGKREENSEWDTYKVTDFENSHKGVWKPFFEILWIHRNSQEVNSFIKDGRLYKVESHK